MFLFAAYMKPFCHSITELVKEGAESCDNALLGFPCLGESWSGDEKVWKGLRPDDRRSCEGLGPCDIAVDPLMEEPDSPPWTSGGGLMSWKLDGRESIYGASGWSVSDRVGDPPRADSRRSARN